MSLSGTAGDEKGGAEMVGLAEEGAGVAAGGVGLEAEEGAEAEGDSSILPHVSYHKCVAMPCRKL